MTRIHATFDGQVFTPEEAPSLEPNRRYVITVEEETSEIRSSEHVLSRLAHLATDLGPSDLAENHDQYALKR